MVRLLACVPLHIDERDHLFDQLWPFEELDIAFIGIGFNIARCRSLIGGTTRTCLSARFPISSFTAFVAGGQVKFSSCGQELQWLMVTRSLCQARDLTHLYLRCIDRVRLAASPEAGGSDCRSAQRNAPLRRPDGSARNKVLLVVMWRVRGVAYKELDMADIGPSTPLPGSERPRPATHRYVGLADPDNLIGVTAVVRPRPGLPPLPDLQQRHDTPLSERRALSRDEYTNTHVFTGRRRPTCAGHRTSTRSPCGALTLRR
jgi:hypothetical protein